MILNVFTKIHFFIRSDKNTLLNIIKIVRLKKSFVTERSPVTAGLQPRRSLLPVFTSQVFLPGTTRSLSGV